MSTYDDMEWFRNLSPEDQAFVSRWGRDAYLKRKELEEKILATGVKLYKVGKQVEPETLEQEEEETKTEEENEEEETEETEPEPIQSTFLSELRTSIAKEANERKKAELLAKIEKQISQSEYESIVARFVEENPQLHSAIQSFMIACGSFADPNYSAIDSIRVTLQKSPDGKSVNIAFTAYDKDKKQLFEKSGSNPTFNELPPAKVTVLKKDEVPKKGEKDGTRTNKA